MTPEAFRASGITEQVAAALAARLAAAPDDAAALEGLARIRRGAGDFAGAAELYARLARAAPGHPTAARALAILEGRFDPALGADALPRPQPFFRREGVLPEARHAEVLARVAETEAEFRPLEVYGMDRAGKMQSARLDALRDQSGRAMPEVADILMPHILDLFPEILAALGLAPFEPEPFKLLVAATHDGQHAFAHSDSYGGKFAVSLLYYFTTPPKRFEGGDLLLYDRARDEDPDAIDFDKFTRLPFADNTLAAFRCEAMHEITRVRLASDRFMDGRFAITGFVRAPG